MTPFVTVLVAAYNGEDFLGEAIESVLAQSFADYELLIVDDASTDASAAVVGAFQDARVRLVRNERNVGQVASLNRGLREARGEVVVRLDQDDMCLPRRLELQVEALRREPAVGLVGGWMEIVDGEGALVGTIEGRIDDRVDFLYWTLVQYVLISHPAAAYRLQPVLELGGYDESLALAEDKDLWRRLLLAGWDGRIVPERIVRYRVHPGQLSQTRALQQRENDARSQAALFAELAPGQPAEALRLLLTGDLGVWQAAAGADLPAALDALIEATRTRFSLGPEETSRLRDLLAERVAGVALAGWRARGGAWRAVAPDLLRWASAERPVRLRARQLAAPALRIADGVLAETVRRTALHPALARLRVRLRRRQTLRRAYARLTRAH
jgi:GT2 family glycosyltransferase